MIHSGLCHDILRLLFPSTLMTLMMASCGGKTTVYDNSDILVKSGDKTLTRQEVLQKIPVGIEPLDSARIFNLIVENWIKSEVLSTLAENKLPDVSDIDNRVREYRNRLIVTEYLQEMKKSGKFAVNEDSVRFFYERHKPDMLTESPLVKGIYVKMASSNPAVDQIRHLVFCGSDDCIDSLEQMISGDAVQYDYFIDNWIDWQIIADRIPFRFENPDIFLQATKNFDTNYNGSTYILHISDYLPSGSVPPYEFASPHIAELMERMDIRKYEESLVRSLIKKALDDGELVGVGYDPLERGLSRSNAGDSITGDFVNNK